jgi:hypothetical protein
MHSFCTQNLTNVEYNTYVLTPDGSDYARVNDILSCDFDEEEYME